MRTVPLTKIEQEALTRQMFEGVFERILQSLDSVESFNIKEDATTIAIEVVLKDVPRHHTFHIDHAYSLGETLQNG